MIELLTVAFCLGVIWLAIKDRHFRLALLVFVGGIVVISIAIAAVFWVAINPEQAGYVTVRYLLPLAVGAVMLYRSWDRIFTKKPAQSNDEGNK